MIEFYDTGIDIYGAELLFDSAKDNRGEKWIISIIKNATKPASFNCSFPEDVIQIDKMFGFESQSYW